MSYRLLSLSFANPSLNGLISEKKNFYAHSLLLFLSGERNLFSVFLFFFLEEMKIFD